MSKIGYVLRGRYELVAEIGKGGMSVVYLAKDLSLGCYWAVKHVVSKSEAEVLAFKKEVELLSSMNHPDIPRIVERINLEGEFFVVMDFVDGIPLGKEIRKNGPQSEEVVLRWGKMLCSILDYLHTFKKSPVVYRDMKPNNIMLTKSGRTMLIDFGIARECTRGVQLNEVSIGTQGFAAPEQYSDGSNVFDERTDIYSFGATMFFLLTGKNPKRPPNGVSSVRLHRPSLSEGIDYIIAKCSDDNPENRYQNCSALREDLDNVKVIGHEYKQLMSRKLTTFISSLVLTGVFLFGAILGLGGMRAESAKRFQSLLSIAAEHELLGDYDKAAEYYVEAINESPREYKPYELLFNTMLPQKADENHKEKICTAIDKMRVMYVENYKTHMYHDEHLMFLLAKKCLEVESVEYARYAKTYIDYIRESKSYKNDDFDFYGLEQYEVLASFAASEIHSQDFGRFNEAITVLEQNALDEKKTNKEKLDIYFLVAKMYATYPGELEDSYSRVLEIGCKAKAIVDEDIEGSIELYTVVGIYRLVAKTQSDYGVRLAGGEKLRAYLKSAEWFGYLENIGAELDLTSVFRKGNVYKNIFNLTVESGKSYEESEHYIAASISILETALEKNSESFLGRIYLAQAHFDMQWARDESVRDFTIVLKYYLETVALKEKLEQNPDNGGESITMNGLNQLNVLKQKLEIAGLI